MIHAVRPTVLPCVVCIGKRSTYTLPYPLSPRASTSSDVAAAARMARRYLGDEGGEQFLTAARQTFTHWVRITLRPEHVRVIDFPNTFPSAWSGAQGKTS
jgi:hypothetical protein